MKTLKTSLLTAVALASNMIFGQGVSIKFTTSPSTVSVNNITSDMTSVGSGAGTGGSFNSFFGYKAGASAINKNNSFFGYQSGLANTNVDNAFFGYNTAPSSTSGGSAIFGSQAGSSMTSGGNNTFIGSYSGGGCTTGTGNVFLGVTAGGPTTTGGNNTFLGGKTGTGNTTGSNNIALGYQADIGGSNLSYATAIGSWATVTASNAIVLGRVNTIDNVGVGVTAPVAKVDVYRPLLTTVTTPIGLQVVNHDKSTSTTAGAAFGISNTIDNANLINIGDQITASGAQLTYGLRAEVSSANLGLAPRDFAYGADLLVHGTGGNGAIGLNVKIDATPTYTGGTAGATFDISSPYYNEGVKVNISGGSNANFAVEGYASGTSGSTTVGGDFSASGGTANYGVRASAPIAASSYAGYFSGNIYCTGSYLPSDEKLKSNVTDYTNAIERLRTIKTHTYTYNTDKYGEMNLPEGKQTGFLANEFAKSFPELTKDTRFYYQDKTKQPVDYKAINYTGLIPYLVEAVQELDAKTTENKALADKVATLQSQLNDICNGGCASLRGTTSDAATTNLLLQNVPNPFSGQTTISYVLNTGTTAYLDVNSLDGKLLKHLELTGKGKNAVTLNASELSAGTYTYSMYVDGQVIDTKIIVISAAK